HGCSLSLLLFCSFTLGFLEKECITTFLSSQQCCPQCRSDVSMEKTSLTTNHALKSLAERVKEIERIKKESGTDSQVIVHCFLCFQQVCSEVKIAKTKEKSQKLMSQISSQFQEMHEFLRKREAEIKNELKLKENEEVEKMNKSANTIETVLSSNKKIEEKMKSALEITNSERFLKMCTEGDSVLKAKSSIQKKAQKLPVINSCLSMGVYESHLQFFVWKEMLKVIKPKPEQLSLSCKSPDGIVSDDGRSFRSACQQCKTQPPAALSKDQFTTGQHYWEVDVGLKNSWKLGLQNHFMSCNGGRYTISKNNVEKNATFTGNIKKLGIYLNCFTKELSFYDADNMKLIETITYQLPDPVAAYFHIQNTEDQFPLTVCWY
uniref:B30.2/SPRY domain-containing protein n=1 Tax=Oryzias melastigma TaxID=30732 RepID=A0A3B3DAA0_ORYME